MVNGEWSVAAEWCVRGEDRRPRAARADRAFAATARGGTSATEREVRARMRRSIAASAWIYARRSHSHLHFCVRRRAFHRASRRRLRVEVVLGWGASQQVELIARSVSAGTRPSMLSARCWLPQAPRSGGSGSRRVEHLPCACPGPSSTSLTPPHLAQPLEVFDGGKPMWRPGQRVERAAVRSSSPSAMGAASPAASLPARVRLPDDPPRTRWRRWLEAGEQRVEAAVHVECGPRHEDERGGSVASKFAHAYPLRPEAEGALRPARPQAGRHLRRGRLGVLRAAPVCRRNHGIRHGHAASAAATRRAGAAANEPRRAGGERRAARGGRLRAARAARSRTR